MSDKSRVLCKYHMSGVCRFGSDCAFSHELSDLPNLVCKFYLAGCCVYGDHCRYDHKRPEYLKANFGRSNKPGPNIQPTARPAPPASAPASAATTQQQPRLSTASGSGGGSGGSSGGADSGLASRRSNPYDSAWGVLTPLELERLGLPSTLSLSDPSTTVEAGSANGGLTEMGAGVGAGAAVAVGAVGRMGGSSGGAVTSPSKTSVAASAVANSPGPSTSTYGMCYNGNGDNIDSIDYHLLHAQETKHDGESGVYGDADMVYKVSNRNFGGSGLTIVDDDVGLVQEQAAVFAATADSHRQPTSMMAGSTLTLPPSSRWAAAQHPWEIEANEGGPIQGQGRAVAGSGPQLRALGRSAGSNAPPAQSSHPTAQRQLWERTTEDVGPMREQSSAVRGAAAAPHQCADNPVSGNVSVLPSSIWAVSTPPLDPKETDNADLVPGHVAVRSAGEGARGHVTGQAPGSGVPVRVPPSMPPIGSSPQRPLAMGAKDQGSSKGQGGQMRGVAAVAEPHPRGHAAGQAAGGATSAMVGEPPRCVAPKQPWEVEAGNSSSSGDGCCELHLQLDAVGTPNKAAATMDVMDPAEVDLCPVYLLHGRCTAGELCPLIHGCECEICHKFQIHPYNPEAAEEHRAACRLRHERLEARMRSSGVECGICLEPVLSKASVAERRFGLLTCDHAFCLGCIRSWRGRNDDASLATDTAVRTCPICRMPSHFVTPSLVWPASPEEKSVIVNAYKEKLGTIDCKHFNFGEGTCPFSTSCFYRHMYRDGRMEELVLRRAGNADGDVRVVMPVRLSAFFEAPHVQRLLGRRR